jgi:phosphopantothenoylcysteine decarboxylase/phosphopantothenate--cysteine ligase
MGTFRDRTVILGVGGGIAAYKACEIVRLLVKGGADVRVVMTPNATRFVGPLTFQALSGHPVLVDLLDTASDASYGHLELARRADILLVAPATAAAISGGSASRPSPTSPSASSPVEGPTT